MAPRTRLLGIDQGEKTLGLAISDSGLAVASALETLRRRKFTQDAQAIREICLDKNVGGLVIGLLETYTGGYIGSGLSQVLPFIVLILILMVKPYGLFGEVRIERV